VYIVGKVGGVYGIYRSDDTGTTWVRVNDDRHQYGGPGNGQFVQGDPYIHGRVYMGTFGRGVVYGDLLKPVGLERQAQATSIRQVSRLQRTESGSWSIEYGGTGSAHLFEVWPDGHTTSLAPCDGPCSRTFLPTRPGRGWILVRSPDGQQILPFVALRERRE
jgi:hypothetical protein